MTIPSPKKDVDRAKVHDEIKRMLWEDDVEKIEIVRQSNGKFRVTPSG